MKFGPVDLDQAQGAILAHSLGIQGGRIRKGRVLDGADIAALRTARYQQVTVARLEPTDVGENSAAQAIATALVPDAAAAGLRLSTAHTGRVNVFADAIGVLELDVSRIRTLNRIDPMITLATAAPFTAVPKSGQGALLGTIKIISFAVSGEILAQAVTQAKDAMRVRRPVISSANLIITKLRDEDPDIRHLAITNRLDALGVVCDVSYVLHQETAIAEALAGSTAALQMVLTASATSDIRDVAPEAVRLAGGQVTRFGLPVDPGNLLFLGALSGKPVIGLPGCARSPALNGADWVLERVICGVDVNADDMAEMGIGGLLKEIPIRGMAREAKP